MGQHEPGARGSLLRPWHQQQLRAPPALAASDAGCTGVLPHPSQHTLDAQPSIPAHHTPTSRDVDPAGGSWCGCGRHDHGHRVWNGWRAAHAHGAAIHGRAQHQQQVRPAWVLDFVGEGVRGCCFMGCGARHLGLVSCLPALILS